MGLYGNYSRTRVDPLGLDKTNFDAGLLAVATRCCEEVALIPHEQVVSKLGLLRRTSHAESMQQAAYPNHDGGARVPESWQSAH